MMKKFILKIGETLSCFFHADIKLMDAAILHGSNMVGLEESKRVYFNNKPTNVVIQLSDLKLLFMSDKKEYDVFMVDLLTNLKGYK